MEDYCNNEKKFGKLSTLTFWQPIYDVVLSSTVPLRDTLYTYL